MGITRIKVDPDDPATFPKGRVDAARVDATTEAEIAAQEREDEEEAMQDMARYARRVRRRMGLSQTELARRIGRVARDDPQLGTGQALPDRRGPRPAAGARQGAGDRAPRPVKSHDRRLARIFFIILYAAHAAPHRACRAQGVDSMRESRGPTV